MYNPKHFEISDLGVIHAFMRENVFATVAGIIDGAIHFAYLPVMLDAEVKPLGSVHFHCARANPLAAIEDGAALKLSIMGAHTYISPDWYETPDQVPTWNYTAVEGSGRVRRLKDDETFRYLEAFAAEQERALAPKAPWSPAKVNRDRLARLLMAITGFELRFDTLEGKAKLSQNRSDTDIRQVIETLNARGDSTSIAVAAAMQRFSVR